MAEPPEPLAAARVVEALPEVPPLGALLPKPQVSVGVLAAPLRFRLLVGPLLWEAKRRAPQGVSLRPRRVVTLLALAPAVVQLLGLYLQADGPGPPGARLLAAAAP